jgi:hypothetical protein
MIKHAHLTQPIRPRETIRMYPRFTYACVCVSEHLQRGVAQALLPVVDLVAKSHAANELGLVLAIEGVYGG